MSLILNYCFPSQVFPYGSIPLKAYLPNRDIDLTTFCYLDFEDFLVYGVYSILMGEEHYNAAQYKVKDVHCIDDEVLLGSLINEFGTSVCLLEKYFGPTNIYSCTMTCIYKRSICSCLW